ncbi:MAG: DUF58 domain-containing protein [Mycetocola sp.]
MDFDDLREYAPGDDVRDIDWKATARSSATLVRRYHAERKQILTFVVNTSRSMSAQTDAHEVKKDVTVTAVGAVGYLTTRHGDDIALVYGDEAAVRRLPTGRSEAHLERLLQTIDSASTPKAAAAATGSLLAFAARSLKRRMIVAVVTDETTLSAEDLEAVRQLAARHTLLWLTIGDTALEGEGSGKPILDIDSGRALPEFFRTQRPLREAATAARASDRESRESLLARLGVAHTVIHSQDEVVPALISLFAQRGHARG